MSFWIPLTVSFGMMILLYTIGFIADLDFLIIKISSSYTEISLFPIFVGVLLGFITERIIKYKLKKSEQ
ncbi:ATPase [Cytobacillus sp. FJAT-54145]|uniref:ATPase n=1 Tax=Cytobacillus spartinae TaxID=3299023 RepID=A0ABW6KA44_9BACI